MPAYQWKGGYATAKVSAQVAGEVCEALEAEGNLTAKNLVNVSRPEEAPLHSSFEWRNDVAAERWREQQARNIINHIEIVSVETNQPVRMFVNIERCEPRYESINVVLRSVDKRTKLLEQAKKEMKRFMKDYEILEELSGVFESMDEVLEEDDAEG